MGDGPDDLETFALDRRATTALHEFAHGEGATWREPALPRQHRGHSGARLVLIVLEAPDGRDAKQLYVKVLPDRRAGEETARHKAALRADPDFATRHLVPQPYSRYPVGDGRFLMFQGVAHGAEQVVSLDDVPDAQLTEAYETLSSCLLEWCRSEQRRSQTTVSRFVERELTDAGAWRELLESAPALGLAEPDADWSRVAGCDDLLPNPLRFAETGTPFGDDQLDQWCGASHGDPHRDNVLYPAPRRGEVRVDEFCLVDAGRFAEDAPLTRDLVILLLDAVLPEVAEGLGVVRAGALRALLINPAEEASERLPPLPAKVIRACYAVGTTYAKKNTWGRAWRAQYLLSLLSQALICCTYDNAGQEGRAWYLRLAAEAGEAYRREFRPDVSPPRPATAPAAGMAEACSVVLDLAWPESPGNAAPPAWTYGVVPLAEWQPSGSAPPGRHGVATSLCPPGGRSTTPGVHGLVPPREAIEAPPFAMTGRHHLDAARTTAPGHSRPHTRARHGAPPPRGASAPAEADAIPHTPRPHAGEPVTPRSTPRRRPPRWMAATGLAPLACLALLAVFGIVVFGRDQPSTGLRRFTVTPPTDKPPASGDASAQLADLALTAAGRPSSKSAGAYTSICRRVWSPTRSMTPGVDRDTYQDELLVWSRKLSGRRVVTWVVAAKRSTNPQVSRYLEGELTEIPPPPSADPMELREQLSAQLDELPPELRNATGLMELVSQLHRYYLLGPAQRSTLLHVLATTPGITARGSYQDWANRPGLAFSADGHGRRETLQFDPESGELRSHQTTVVPSDLTLSYQLFLARTRTDSSTQGRCR